MIFCNKYHFVENILKSAINIADIVNKLAKLTF